MYLDGTIVYKESTPHLAAVCCPQFRKVSQSYVLVHTRVVILSHHLQSVKLTLKEFTALLKLLLRPGVASQAESRMESSC